MHDHTFTSNIIEKMSNFYNKYRKTGSEGTRNEQLDINPANLEKKLKSLSPSPITGLNHSAILSSFFEDGKD